jgi:5-formyltetrahydrofolate cyclo-ligase
VLQLFVLQQEVQQLMALAESEDRKNVPDGMEVPKEIALRQLRLAVLDRAKRKLEARAKERDQAPQAEYEGKLAKRQAKRDTTKLAEQNRNSRDFQVAHALSCRSASHCPRNCLSLGALAKWPWGNKSVLPWPLMHGAP